MELQNKIIMPLIMWLILVCLILLFSALYRWAKKRKGVAIAVGLFIQMFLPDPKVQQTIEFVAESKQKTVKSEKEKGSSDLQK